MPDFLLPDLGEGLTEAEVVTWLVQVGDQVRVDQPVVEVETAKASVQVPVPFAGRVTVLHAEAGTLVPVGAPLISVAEKDFAGFNEPGIETAQHHASGNGGGSGNVLIGYGTPTDTTRRRRRHRPTRTARPLETQAVRVISPLVRRIAHDAALDLKTVHGSGPDGLIMRADINRAISERTPVSRQTDRGFERIPLTGVRRTTAEKLTRSRREIPEATIWTDADATGFLEARTALNAAAPEHPISLVALLARFTVAALRRFPELNATVENDEIRQHRAVHLGLAAQTERGLLVPVIHDADLLTTRTLAAAIQQTTLKAREGKLSPAELIGGTFTVNNYGVFGTDGAAAIINHPEAAILGLGRIAERPWVVAGQLAVRKVTQLTLSFDHRVCDGATAGGFLRFVADCVENPVTVLGDL